MWYLVNLQNFLKQEYGAVEKYENGEHKKMKDGGGGS